MKSKIRLSLFLSILISFSAFSQWKYPNAKTIKDDVIITYEVKYDRELSEEEKQSPRFKREIVVIFNKNKLLEKTFSNTVNSETSVLMDYKEELVYNCTTAHNMKEAIKFKFQNPKKEIILQESEEETILGFPCQVSTTKMEGKVKKIYTTKAFGLKYVKNFKTEGFLMKYVAKDKYLGYYTVSAKKITYGKLDETIYSLKGYTIKTIDEHIENLKKRKETSNTANEKAIKKIGEMAPKYSAISIDGKKLKSKSMKGKIVVLNFWFTTCPPCRKEIPQLNQLKEKYKDKNVEFIAVALDAEYKISEFLKLHPFTFDIVEDGRWIADKFEIKAYPSNIIIDENGNIQYFKIGYKKDIIEMMSYQIEKLLNKN